MKDFSKEIMQVEKAGNEIFWQGAASVDQIKTLENALDLILPEDFCDFLKTYGGGGVISEEISGIESNDATLTNGGTVYGDTLEVRKRFQLPQKLAVVVWENDEICWCLDCTQASTKLSDVKIVNYNIFTRKVDVIISNNFERFFAQYLELRSQ
ncbi:SMI1/KNR4 family protein [Marinomonas sp. 2405UD68-3]|uniref:SMI1/KNR4 family protein n=1 Tax=Marinomonas sp. 2405UD68-3 TaxID=3391835 RepID=UPI0039C975A6